MRDTQAFAWLHALKTLLSTDMYRFILSCARNIITSHPRQPNDILFAWILTIRRYNLDKDSHASVYPHRT